MIEPITLYGGPLDGLVQEMVVSDDRVIKFYEVFAFSDWVLYERVGDSPKFRYVGKIKRTLIDE